jgi:hypothetical protein
MNSVVMAALIAIVGGGDQVICPCQEASGPCGKAHGSGGCGVACCCVRVCEFDNYCCDVQWDIRCVLEASTLCRSCEFCRGDIDGDQIVDGLDLGRLLGEWGQSGREITTDLDENGVVDSGDLGLMLGQWGSCFPECE